MSLGAQGCALRKITRSPEVPNYEIQGAQHKAYMKKGKAPLEHSPGANAWRLVGAKCKLQRGGIYGNHVSGNHPIAATLSGTVTLSEFSGDTVKPLLSSHPPLGGQFSKSRNYSQYNTVKLINFHLAAISIMRLWPHFSFPDNASLIDFTSFSGQQNCEVQILSRWQPPLDR